MFVIVPGMRGTKADWDPLIERLRADVPDATFRFFPHGGSAASGRRLHGYALDLAAKVNEWFELDKPERISLLGHSFGGVLVRLAYLIAAGEARDVQPMAWAGAVDRIILFAGMNRGFDPARLGPIRGRLTRLVLLVPIFRLMRDLARGSDAMTHLRIGWIRHFRELGDRQPVVIQLRGTQDVMVEDEDSVDVDQFPRARQEYVAGASHGNLYKLPAEGADDRYAFLRERILHMQGSAASPHTDTQATDVVFLVHGIRASSSQWPERAERIITSEFPNVVPVPAGYSYFSALNFAVPFLRRRQIRWMQDEYSYRFAKHVNARFHFIGHSNGTYLLGNTLKKVPSAEFDGVTLVGSVLPQDFGWQDLVDRTGRLRVARLRNHRARYDLPVSILCSFLRGLGMRDVGTAGVDGFLFAAHGFKRETFYYPGGHGAALQDDANLRRLVESTLGASDPPLELDRAGSVALGRVSRAVNVLAWVLVIGALAGLWFLAGWLGGVVAPSLGLDPAWARVVAAGGIVALLLVILKVV